MPIIRLLTLFFVHFLILGCFQEKTSTQTEKKEVNQTTEIPQESLYNEDLYVEEVPLVFPPPVYPALPVSEDLIPTITSDTIDLIDIKNRTVSAELLKLKNDMGSYTVSFLRSSDQKEFTLDLRTLSEESQQIVFAWDKYFKYLEEKKVILAAWEEKRDKFYEEHESGGSTTANQIFDSLSTIGQ